MTTTMVTESVIELSIDAMIEKAQQSKVAFIQFMKDIGLVQVRPYLPAWLKEYWTDEMSKVFFSTYWNGSLDDATLFTGSEELPSLLDDVCKCMDDMRVVC